MPHIHPGMLGIELGLVVLGLGLMLILRGLIKDLFL